jgi:hypothetical protein
MEISKTYQIKIENVLHYVYEGTCDGIPTKWITKTKWNGKISVTMNNGEIAYTDTNGSPIVVFDENDVEYPYIQE